MSERYKYSLNGGQPTVDIQTTRESRLSTIVKRCTECHGNGFHYYLNRSITLINGGGWRLVDCKSCHGRGEIVATVIVRSRS